MNIFDLQDIITGRMEKQRHENKSLVNQKLMSGSTAVNAQHLIDLAQIKQEPNIKLELDEVDTIEYTQTSIDLKGLLTPKVEKIKTNDNEDEMDNESALFDRNARMGSKSVDDEQPCSSQMGNHVNVQCGAIKPRKERADAGAKTPTLGKTNRKATKAVKKTQNRRSASIKKKKQHKCQDCDYVSTRLSHLKRNMLIHTGEKPHACASCTKRFRNRWHLQRHLIIHINKDSVQCTVCLKICATKEEKLIHESMCKRRRYECFLCQAYSTPYITKLKRHMLVHSEERLFKCDECLMNFKLKFSLDRHMKTHNRPSKPQCSVCARNFWKQSEKEAHEMNCVRRRYECYLCSSYMINKKQHLQYHIRTKHTGERPYKCSVCAKRYPRKSDFKRHIKKFHKQ